MKIRVLVKPRSRKSTLEKTEHDHYIAFLKSPPVDGKANNELTQLVSMYFKIPKSRIQIVSGASARFKLLDLEGLDDHP